jgi:hypothetical protein
MDKTSQKAGTSTQFPHSGTTATSTDSGQGSEPLSEAFVAVKTDAHSKGLKRHVKAPALSSQMEI